jgi:cytochrome d ubiquinol oxidase subunit I
MLFGWNRVSKKMHFAATVIVACGHPDFGLLDPVRQQLDADARAFREGADGLLYPTDWLAVIFNPSFPTASSTWSPPPT